MSLLLKDGANENTPVRPRRQVRYPDYIVVVVFVVCGMSYEGKLKGVYKYFCTFRHPLI